MRRDEYTDGMSCGHSGAWWCPSQTGPRIGDTHCLKCAREESRTLGYVKPRRRTPAHWSE